MASEQQRAQPFRGLNQKLISAKHNNMTPEQLFVATHWPNAQNAQKLQQNAKADIVVTNFVLNQNQNVPTRLRKQRS